MERPKLNAFQSYAEFLDDRILNKINDNTEEDEFANDMFTASDIDVIVKKKFYKAEYPADLSISNVFCPICGKIVKMEEVFSVYDSENYHRRFIAHDLCLGLESSRCLNDIFDHVEEMKFEPIEKKAKMKTFSIGDREFCLELTISHPLSDLKFIKLITKSTLNGSTIHWDLQQEDEQFCYQPNIICFPFIDFKICLTVSEIGAHEGKRTITNYINLSRTKYSIIKETIAKSEELKLEIKIHNTVIEKEQAISTMNYKYQYPHNTNLPIIQLCALDVQIPEEEYDEDLENSKSKIVDELLSERNEESSYGSSVHLYSTAGKNYGYFEDNFSNGGNTPNLSSFNPNTSHFTPQIKCEQISSAEKEKVDLEKLISTNKLSSYVRNGAQSRIFQNFLEEANSNQVEMIIHALYEEFTELVTDEYANYMTQKLFEVSSLNQRIMILTKLYPYIPALVKNKQGTHTIQAFISLLKLNQEFGLICQSIQQEFEHLCFHHTSTHFIQKIIQIFPLDQTREFFFIANANFLKFATDKNAMCVLKYMLRRIKENENDKFITEIRKNFINSITLSTDKIIQDSYGNYVVQFCYELFGESKSSGITEMIIEKFVQFSLQKYSSSVISKCINSYWTDRSYVNKLKDSLKNDGIFEMYRNREGNKILLDLMDKNENTLLRDKIYNLLANGESSKFYHDRWGVQIGIRSGPVGSEFRSFTEADLQRGQQSSNKKNKKK